MMRESSLRARWVPAVALLAVAAVAGTHPSAAAGAGQSFYFSVDVPTRLGANDYLTNQVIRGSFAAYALEVSFPADVAISALELRELDGAWLFTPADPVTIDGTAYTARDVVAWNGAAFSIALDGAAAGIPADARIDALSADPSGGFLLSFEAPVLLGATDYGPADLVRYNAGFSLAWSGSSASVPAYANLVGASRDASGALVLAFDVPVNLGGSEYLPGDLVRWGSPGGFSLAVRDSNWPKASELRDFTYAPGVGDVPDGGSGGPRLTVSRQGMNLTLAWGAACGATAGTDYAVYEGTIGSWYSHAPRICSTGGQLSSQFAVPPGNPYFLIVARNGAREGSHGKSSSGAEIPPGASVCVPQEIATCP